MENNHPGISDPELFFTPPPPLIFPTFHPFTPPASRGADARRLAAELMEINPALISRPLSFLLFFTSLLSQIDSQTVFFSLIITQNKCLVRTPWLYEYKDLVSSVFAMRLFLKTIHFPRRLAICLAIKEASAHGGRGRVSAGCLAGWRPWRRWSSYLPRCQLQHIKDGLNMFPGNIAHSPQHRSVLLREAILGAADKLIFVYNLSQKIQMIG